MGGWLLPDRRGGELTETYELGGYITELRVMAGSNLIGKTVRESEFGKTEDVTVLRVASRGQTHRIAFLRAAA